MITGFGQLNAIPSSESHLSYQSGRLKIIACLFHNQHEEYRVDNSTEAICTHTPFPSRAVAHGVAMCRRRTCVHPSVRWQRDCFARYAPNQASVETGQKQLDCYVMLAIANACKTCLCRHVCCSRPTTTMTLLAKVWGGRKVGVRWI